ncbi:MAG: DUF4861 family protein [Bacteroidota bacterium]
MKFFFFSVFIISFSFAQTSGITCWVENPINFPRSSETISINMGGVYQQHPNLRGKYIAVFEAKKEILSQLIDNDFDGQYDELIFQSSFKPKETKEFQIRPSKQNKMYKQPLVDGRYVLPREDFAWENDRIAFRVYGSVLAGNVDNGIDVWTKRVRYPIIEKWYAGEEQTPKIVYHEDHGEGADFFSVGKSLGAGSAGILWNGKLVQGGLFTHYRVVANGPVRISFELYYTNWKLDTAKYLEIKRITLDAGEQLNEVEEQFISNASTDSLTLVAGLVKRSHTTFKRSMDHRYMSLWGLTTSDSSNGFLGTAVIFPSGADGIAIEDTIHYLMSHAFDTKKKFTYYTGAAWTRMGDINSKKEWIRYLDEFVMRKNNPLKITFQKKKY